ncbi:MAG: DUF6152 family protein [Gammaproteobacteria bacterium]|nr:DUF6152 family protein [Gammaproteobacteria bacterium]MDH3508732.1 DUF6152 family protein [Gammaproteobacteria bacterium]
MKRTTICMLALMAIAPAIAHHSDAGIDMDSTIEIDGTVTEFHWRNPHVYFMVEAPNERGEPVEWSIQMGSTITTARTGWSRDYLTPGDPVVVRLHPAISGRPYGILESIDKGEDALPTLVAPGSSETLVPPPDGTAQAESLAGVWFADRARIRQYPGGFDGYFNAELQLTPAGAAAKAAYDPLSADNPEAQCIGRPTPAMIVSSQLYPIRVEINEAEQTVTLRTEFWDETRTVYMDGRGHPDDGERSISGHSIGRWEGGTLVVDTRNFADHRSPYQIGVPSGALKHVVERYTLSEDRTRVFVEFTLEDPEFIAEPLTHSRELLYAPQMTLQPFECDPEATRRFLETGG